VHVLLYCGVSTGVRLLPPGENPIAVRNNNNNNNNNSQSLWTLSYRVVQATVQQHALVQNEQRV
jgi:hypothetical protein